MAGELAELTKLAELTQLADEHVPDATALLAELPYAVLVVDLSGNIRRRSPGYSRLFDDVEPFELIHLRDLFDDTSRALVPEAIAAAFAAAGAGREGIVDLTATCLRLSGLPFPVGVTIRAVQTNEPGSAFFVVALRPFGEEVRRADRLRHSEHRFATLMAHLPVGIIGSESGLRADYANAAAAEAFGVGPESLLGLGWLDLVHPADRDRVSDAVEEALEARRPAFLPARTARLDGDDRFVHLRIAPVGVGDDAGFVASVEDVTAQRLLGEAVQHQARHDLLTGLLNRSTVEERVSLQLAQARASGARPAVLFVDIDDFKDVNDSLGHLVGDRLLIAIADRLYAAGQPLGTVARFGGDEFVLIFPHVPSASVAADLGRRVVHDLDRPVEIDGHVVHVTASVGVAWVGADDLSVVETGVVDASELLRRADLALFQAKRSGKHQAVVADEALLFGERQRLQMARALRRAVDDDLLEVHYQPIVDLDDERIIGLEALVRWTDPELGRVSPDRFIPAAEAHGLVGVLGRNVLRRALADLAVWRRQPGYERLYVSVNMSMHELDSQTVARGLAQALGEADLPASALYVELTESALLRRETTTVERLDAIRRLGIRLAIDDFGTGHSSLARLRRLPVDLVKIDREFVRHLGIDPQAAAIVRAIAALAEALGLHTVAEGVETDRQLAELRRVAGGYGQGYLFSEPLPAAAIPDLLGRRPLRHAA